MPIRTFLPLLIILFELNTGIYAQKRLNIDLSSRCDFGAALKELELYSFESPEQEVQQLINLILVTGGNLEQNFTLVQSNVLDVSAVLDGSNRYILWSLEFWESASPLMRLSSFAHEIGHHVNQHRLSNEYRPVEEPEADEFMGFILGGLNVSRWTISRYPDSIGLYDAGIYGEEGGYDRISMVQEGCAKAAETLNMAALPFEDDPSWEKFLKAKFPFPPPPCFQSAELSFASFAEIKTLGQLGQKISYAFREKGYPYRFMSVPDGFAVVTQLEQYQEDGSIDYESGARWQELPRAESFSLSLQYLKSLVFPRTAHLRVFVVLVSSQSYPSDQKRVTKEEAKSWASLGVNRLPKAIADKPFSERYAVDLLVYEFEVPETNYKPAQQCPCHLDAWEHLKKTGLNQWFR